MTEVEQYWQTIATKFGDSRSWSELSSQEQILIIQSINMLLAVLNNRPNKSNTS